MKRISLVFALLLLNSLALTASDTPAAVPQPASPAPAACSADPLKSAGLIPDPVFKGSIPPPCVAMTWCPDGSTIMCPNTSYHATCWSSEGCWVNCYEDGWIFCPGRESAPECAMW